MIRPIVRVSSMKKDVVCEDRLPVGVRGVDDIVVIPEQLRCPWPGRSASFCRLRIVWVNEYISYLLRRSGFFGSFGFDGYIHIHFVISFCTVDLYEYVVR